MGGIFRSDEVRATRNTEVLFEERGPYRDDKITPKDAYAAVSLNKEYRAIREKLGSKAPLFALIIPVEPEETLFCRDEIASDFRDKGEEISRYLRRLWRERKPQCRAAGLSYLQVRRV